MIVGMDFGTTNSGMAVFDGQKLQMIPLDATNQHSSVARTALYITNDRRIYIGRHATDMYYQQNLNRPSKIERVHVGEIEMTFAEIGTFIRDVYIEKDIYSPGRLFLSFKMGLSSPNYIGTIIGTQYFFLEDIIATYLYVTKKRAETYLQTELDTIVLGRPVRYSDNPEHNIFAKERLLRSAFRAGYKRVYLQYEPIAAAHYYETTINTEQNVLIFDFGGGTLDLSIVRVGNPNTRRVIANHGIPIAGDIFDEKIVRAKYPIHFGESTTYLSGRSELTVPTYFYDSFSDWQSMLTMQTPKNMDTLRQIERTARQPRKIQALTKLITGHYALKMYDLAEQAKRQLSNQVTSRLDMEGNGFRVFESISRTEFDRIIRTDVRAIGERIDTVMDEAGLTNADIDVVIRTGGSSQIPIFVDLLEARFGADKVRDIDTFSSVTAGLGVIAHQVESGELEMYAYTPDNYRWDSIRKDNHQTRVAPVDLAVIKQIIDVQEKDDDRHLGQSVLLTRQPSGKIFARYLDQATTAFTVPDEQSFALALDSAEPVILLTTDYHVHVKSVRDLADLNAGGLFMEDLEGFRKDSFSQEYIYNAIPRTKLDQSESVIAVSSLGYTQKYLGNKLVEKLDRPTAYRLERLRGYPVALVGGRDSDCLIAITQAGRAVRIPIGQIPLRENRLMTVSANGAIIMATDANPDDHLLLVTKQGTAQRIIVSQIPLTQSLNTSGEKVFARTGLVSAHLLINQAHLHLMTNHGIRAVSLDSLPPIGAEVQPIVKLAKHEHIIATF